MCIMIDPAVVASPKYLQMCINETAKHWAHRAVMNEYLMDQFDKCFPTLLICRNMKAKRW